MRISENIPALNAYTSLLRSNKKVESSMKRLSSGYRINSVKDDSAGLSVANKLQDQILGLNKAERNSMDGISAVQTAEGAMQEIQNMLQRIRELAVQAANDTNEPEDRKKLNKEVEALIAEIGSITQRTEFNKIKLLNGDAGRLGIASNEFLGLAKCTYISDAVPRDSLSFTIDSIGMPAVVNSGTMSMTAVATGKLTINGEEIEFTDEDTPDSVLEKFKELCDRSNIELRTIGRDWDDVKTGAATLMMFTKDAGTAEHINISGDPAILSMLGLTDLNVTGTDAQISGVSLEGVGLSAVVKGNNIELTGTSGQKINIALQLNQPDQNGVFKLKNGETVPLTGSVSGMIDMTDYGMLKLQIGPNKLMEMNLQIPCVSSSALGIENLSIKSFEGTQRALTQVDNALSWVSSVRSSLGAFQNRLEYTSKSLAVTSENTQQAKSRIFDTDMAWEIAEMTKYNVISQAGISIMAQANQRPQQILQLIK